MKHSIYIYTYAYKYKHIYVYTHADIGIYNHPLLKFLSHISYVFLLFHLQLVDGALVYIFGTVVTLVLICVNLAFRGYHDVLVQVL